MKRIDIVASEATFEMLGTFETIEGLNETVREYKCKFKEMFSDTEMSVLDILHRYSAKYKGVSFLRKNKIAELVGKSRRTIIRVCNRLEELGIIRQYAMKRASDMQQTSNAIVIQHANKQKIDDVAANVTQESSEMSYHENNISLKQKSIHNRHGKPSDPDENAVLKDAIPGELYQVLKPFFSAQELYKVIGLLWRSKFAATGELQIRVEDYVEDYANAFRFSILQLKRGKIRNLDGYLFAAWRKVTSKIRSKIVRSRNPQHPVFRDWLNDETGTNFITSALDELGVY